MAVERARAELTALFEQWLERIPGGDDDFFGRVLDDDWVYTDIAGTVRGKAEYLEYLKPVPPTVSGRLLELEPRLHGELALVTGRYRIEGALPDGTDVSSDTRFTAVWKHTAEGWRALAHHATTIVGE